MLKPSKLDAHIAQFGIELEGMHPALATNTRLPRTTKWRAQVAQEPAVGPWFLGDLTMNYPPFTIRHEISSKLFTKTIATGA